MGNILTKTVTAASLKGKSDSILAAFTKTIDSLREVANTASNEAKVKAEEIVRMETEKTSLEQVAAENLLMADKFSKFLSSE